MKSAVVASKQQIENEFAEKYGIYYQPSAKALATSLGKLASRQFARDDQMHTSGSALNTIETLGLGTTISFGDFRAPEIVLPGEQVENFVKKISMYHAFQVALPIIIEQEDLLHRIVDDLVEHPTKLEYKGLPVTVNPILSRDDIVYNREKGLVLVDPNLSPLGTAEILCMWDYFRDGSCNPKRFAINTARYFENQGLKVGESRIGLITYPDYVAAQSQKAFAAILTSLGWKCECVEPSEIGLEFATPKKYDLLWNHVRTLPVSIIKYAEENRIPIIDKPGFRIAESQLWFALLQLQALKPLFLRQGVSVDALSMLIPKSVLLKRVGSNIMICDGVSKEGLTYSIVDLNALRKKLGNNSSNVGVLKSLDTSGSKGVQVTHITRPKLLEKLPEDGTPVTIQECISNSIPGTKLELYSVSNGTALQPFALAAMTSNTGGVIVHGGSETYQALCKYAFTAM